MFGVITTVHSSSPGIQHFLLVFRCTQVHKHTYARIKSEDENLQKEKYLLGKRTSSSPLV